jgi:hypothetical protein
MKPAKRKSVYAIALEGDRNMSYFHAQTTHRKCINKIASLMRQDGTLCANEEEDKSEVHSFYEELYSSQEFHDIISELMVYVVEWVTSENECVVG